MIKSNVCQAHPINERTGEPWAQFVELHRQGIRSGIVEESRERSGFLANGMNLAVELMVFRLWSEVERCSVTEFSRILLGTDGQTEE